jgi:hypothetical protein
MDDPQAKHLYELFESWSPVVPYHGEVPPTVPSTLFL